MSSTPLAAILIGYLVFLFLVAAVAERFGRRLASPRLQTLTYVLAISVYCTAWTFYGSVGLAANRGLEFLTIYLGPALVALLWPTVLRKLVRVAKEQRITTISDFIASRYGKSAPLGTLVAALVVCGMIPYIALQLKAVSVSFAMMIGTDSVLSGFDPALLVAAMLALFGILFGARNLDFTREQTGLMSAVAVESIVKLVAFLLVGAFVTWGLFDGFTDIFSRIVDHPEWSTLAHPGHGARRLLHAVDGDAAGVDGGRDAAPAPVSRPRRAESARGATWPPRPGPFPSTCWPSTCSCSPSPSAGWSGSTAMPRRPTASSWPFPSAPAPRWWRWRSSSEDSRPPRP